MITEQQYTEAVAQRKQAETIINEYHKQSDVAFKERLESGVPFTDDELRYSAVALCPCGHGIAYPKNCPMNHYWDCSAILKGIADPSVKHTDQLPFMFYEIKSEDQPSANGSTTRGVFKPQSATPQPPTQK